MKGQWRGSGDTVRGTLGDIGGLPCAVCEGGQYFLLTHGTGLACPEREAGSQLGGGRDGMG